MKKKFEQGPCVSCGHWKHDLYWDMLSGKVTVTEDPLQTDPDCAHSDEVLDIANNIVDFLIPLFFGVGNIFHISYPHIVFTVRHPDVHPLC